MSNKIKATCEQIDVKTDRAIPGTVRLIGYFDTQDQASFAAFAQRWENETVCLHDCPLEEEYDMSALEMAEEEANWNEISG